MGVFIYVRLWISPKLPQLPLDADAKSGDSPTHFKADLVRYLRVYQLPLLEEWLEKVQRADFSSVRYRSGCKRFITFITAISIGSHLEF